MKHASAPVLVQLMKSSTSCQEFRLSCKEIDGDGLGADDMVKEHGGGSMQRAKGMCITGNQNRAIRHAANSRINFFAPFLVLGSVIHLLVVPGTGAIQLQSSVS